MKLSHHSLCHVFLLLGLLLFSDLLTAPVSHAQAAPRHSTLATRNAPDTDVCGTTATAIHAVQGATAVTPLLGQTVTIEGIVVGDFQDVKTQLRGFFVQEETADQDDDATTSEGIFVLDNGFAVDVLVGDRVRVRGLVHEFNTMTELKRIESVVICDHDNPVTPTPVTLPETANGDLEHYEGMFIRLVNEMTVAQTYFLGRYGQMTLAAMPTL